MQHFRRERRVEQGSGFGVALPQSGEANLIVIVLLGAGLVLGDFGLDGLVVAEELGDPERASFIYFVGRGLARLPTSCLTLSNVELTSEELLTSVCHWISIGFRSLVLSRCDVETLDVGLTYFLFMFQDLP